MKYKNVQRIILPIGIIITILLVIWLCFSAYFDKCTDFWKVTFSEWVPVFIGFEVAFLFSFYFTNRKHDYEKQLQTYEDIIIKMQRRLADDSAHLFSYNLLNSQIKAKDKTKFYEKELLIYFRSLSNYVDFLEKNKGNLPIDEELQFVRTHIEEYKFEMTENIQDYQSVKDKRVYAKKEVDLIDIKLDEIRIKLYN